MPPRRDFDYLPALAEELLSLLKDARSLCKNVKLLYDRRNPSLRALPLDTLTVLLLTPPLTASYERLRRQIASDLASRRQRFPKPKRKK